MPKNEVVETTKPTLLSREQILAADDIKDEYVSVPEWGGTVRVQGLTGAQRDAFEVSLIEQKKGKSQEVNLRNLRAKMVSWSIVNDLGNRLFSDHDVNELGQKSAKALQRVFKVARELSGIDEEDIDELTAELGEDPSDASGSDSASL